MKSVLERGGAGIAGLYQFGVVALTAAANVDSLSGNMLLNVLQVDTSSMCECLL